MQYINMKDLANRYHIDPSVLYGILEYGGWISAPLRSGMRKMTSLGVQNGGQIIDDAMVWSATAVKKIDHMMRTIKNPTPNTIKDQASPPMKQNKMLKTKDGHMVRSRAEWLIDDWLFDHQILHGYELRLPFAEERYCDFYLPSIDAYVEYWGMATKKYKANKLEKKKLYQQYKIKLIEIVETDLNHLDQVLYEKIANPIFKQNK